MEQFIVKNNKKLRIGYTTGTCALAASKAACMMLFSKNVVNNLKVDTLKGITFDIEIKDIKINENSVSCCVTKDGGDDPDATHGMLIYSTVSFNNSGVINLDGGKGIGRVTKKGLDQPVGNAAINSVPRRLILEDIKKICEEYNYNGGLDIIISAPDGEEIAKRTFNPKLGIVGGISIIGTTGIVMPMSEDAIFETIKTEMRMLAANGYKDIMITPGNYGETYLRETLKLKGDNLVKCSNFVGDSIEYASFLGFENILLVGHIGKMIKLSGGIMNTHSKYGECRAELFSCFAALHGMSNDGIKKIMDSSMTDDMIDILNTEGLKDVVMEEVTSRIINHIRVKAHCDKNFGLIVFSNVHGVLGKSDNFEEIKSKFEE